MFGYRSSRHLFCLKTVAETAFSGVAKFQFAGLAMERSKTD